MHTGIARPATVRMTIDSKGGLPLHLLDMARAAHRAAREFHLVSRDFGHLGEHVRTIEDVLHGRDETGAPLEREAAVPLRGAAADLSATLSAVAHAIDAAATRVGLYRMPSPHAHLEPVAARMSRLCGALAEAVAAAVYKPEHDAIDHAIERIHRLSAETQVALYCATEDLADTRDGDPLIRIMWQEIYERIQAAARKCDSAALILADCADSEEARGRTCGNPREEP